MYFGQEFFSKPFIAIELDHNDFVFCRKVFSLVEDVFRFGVCFS